MSLPSSSAVSALLRPGLLDGVSLLLAAASEPPASASEVPASEVSASEAAASTLAFAAAVGAGCAALGAHVATAAAGIGGATAGVDGGAYRAGVDGGAYRAGVDGGAYRAGVDGGVSPAAVVQDAGKLDLLAVDGAGLFAAGLARAGGDGHAALRACLDGAWNATCAAANGAFLSAAGPGGGRIVYLAPPPGVGEHAEAARAGLENLARTLSIEWARYHITTVTIAPGDDTAASDVATLVAYLASPAGAYFSGCLLDLRGLRAG